MVEVEIVDDAIAFVPVRVVLPPWRDKVLLFKVKVPVPAVMVLPIKLVAVAVPKEEVAVAVMEVNDGLLDIVIWVEVPMSTFCPPLMFKLLPTVKEAKVLVPVPPLRMGRMPETLEVKLIWLAVICWPDRDR